jgi:hypothetical protein
LPGCQEWGKMSWSPPYLGGIVGNLLKNKRTVGKYKPDSQKRKPPEQSLKDTVRV